MVNNLGFIFSKEKTIIINLLEHDEISWSELIELIPFSKSTILKYVDILNNRCIIDHYYDKYVIADNMLKLWLNYKKEMDGHYPN